MSDVMRLGMFPNLWSLNTNAFYDFVPIPVDVSRRDPAYHTTRTNPGDIARAWHQDCGATTRWVLVWADRYPTEIRDGSGIIHRGQAFELIAFNNPFVEHRMPVMPDSQWRQRHAIIVRIREASGRQIGRYADYLRSIS